MPVDELLPRAADVDVLDAQQEAAARGLRALVADEGRQRMPQMQFAVGARSKAEDRRVGHCGPLRHTNVLQIAKFVPRLPQ